MKKLDFGGIGESIVMTSLLWRSWQPVNLNHIKSHMPNTDILAAKGNSKVCLQVKTSGPNSLSMLQIGYKGSLPVFNSKDGPRSDFIVFVRLFGPLRHECYIVPVAEAERVAIETAQDWLNTPKLNGEKREKNFPYCIRFEPNSKREHVSNYKEKWAHYREAWNLLEEGQV